MLLPLRHIADATITMMPAAAMPMRACAADYAIPLFATLRHDAGTA